MQRVGVLGGHLQEVVVAGVDAHAVVDVLGEPRFRLAVALHAHHLEADHHAIADAVAVAGGEVAIDAAPDRAALGAHADRSEEHTSELQSLMRISYAVFCLKKKIQKNTYHKIIKHN